MATAACGTVAFAVAGPAASLWLLAVSLVVREVGLVSANIAITAGAYQGLAPAWIPDASLATRIVHQLAGAFGTAVLALVGQPGLRQGPGTSGTASAFATAFRWSLGFTALALTRAGRARPRDMWVVWRLRRFGVPRAAQTRAGATMRKATGQEISGSDAG